MKDELIDYYEKHKPFSKNSWRVKENREFLDKLKEEFSFVGGMKGNPSPTIYLKCLTRGITSPPPCKYCGEGVKSISNNEFSTYCSKKCSGLDTKIVNLPHHAKTVLNNPEAIMRELETRTVDEIAENLEVTSRTVYNYMMRHGIPRNGNIDRIPSSVRSILECRETMLNLYCSIGAYGISEKYDISKEAVYNALKKHKIPTTNGVYENSYTVLSNPDVLRNYYKQSGIRETSRVLGVNRTTVYNRMVEYGIERDNNFYTLEESMARFLDSIGVEYERNNRKILDGVELDFFIPDKNVAIEMNGLYWHSDKFKEKDYHLNKTNLCNERGIQLLHIYEDEWNSRRKQWEQKVSSILGTLHSKKIGARKTRFQFSYSSKHLKEFMDEHHIQGHVGGFLSASLISDGEIIAAAIFQRSGKSDYIYLSRYATSCIVQGGLSKILKNIKFILKKHGVEKIVSFADKGMSDGSLYFSTGWIHECDIPPDYRYIVNNLRVRKQNFRKKRLRRILGDRYDPSSTEKENMQRVGLHRIYDSGLMKFKFPL